MAEPVNLNDLANQAVDSCIEQLEKARGTVGEILLVMVPADHRPEDSDIPSISSGFFRTRAHGIDLAAAAFAGIAEKLGVEPADLLAVLSAYPFAQPTTLPDEPEVTNG